MRKIALTSLLAVFAVSGAHAATDYFVGGSFGFSTDNEHNSAFEIVPEFGWKYNDKWDFGVRAGFMRDHNHDASVSMYQYAAGVFARYNLVQFGDLKVLLRGDAYVSFNTLDEEGFDTETWASMGLSVAPMVTYDISESFTLYAKLNFLSIDAGYDFEHNGDIYSQDSAWSIDVFGNSSDVADTGNFQIGFNYNF